MGRNNPDIPRIATAFGGGIGRSGSVCGAISGAIMAIGLAHGRSNPEEPRDPAYTRAYRLFQEFQRAMGKTHCRELTGFDLSTPEGYQQFRESGVHERVCRPAVALAARLAEELIRQE
jgi:C_GCAxxG_C_C family probable redox protein